MKNKTLINLVIFTLASAINIGSLSAQKDVSAEIMLANNNFMKLFNRGDVDKFISVYTEDARLLPPNSPAVSGMDNIKSFWKGMMSAGITPKLNTVSAKKYGKIAIEEGIVKIYVGDVEVDNVKYLVVWKKIKGSWKMHQDIWNSNNPIPDN